MLALNMCRILSMDKSKMSLHMLMSVSMVGWVNLVFISQVRINGVQRPVKGESHNPVGVTRPVWGCFEIGKRKQSSTLFFLVYVLGRHVGNSPSLSSSTEY